MKPEMEFRSTLSRESCCIAKISVETTGYRGGDTGHGGWTRVSILNEGSTDLRCGYDNGQAQSVDEVSIMVGGDDELDMLAEFLRFAADELDRAIERSRNKP